MPRTLEQRILAGDERARRPWVWAIWHAARAGSCGQHFGIDGRELAVFLAARRRGQFQDVNHFLCEACEENFLGESNSAPGGCGQFCDNCYDEIFGTCDECGNTFERDELSGGMCDECYETERGPRLRPYAARADGILGRDDGPHAYTIGIEIECVAPAETACDMVEQIEATKVAICKSDSSINANGDGFGVEVVTKIMTEKTYRGHISRLTAILTEAEVTAWDEKSCGLHVHVGRDGLSTAQILRTAKFLAGTQKFWPIFAPGREKNSYCSPKVTSSWLESCYRDSRYRALNMQNDRTIEFRIFRSSRNATRVIACVQFCLALLEYCKFGRPTNRWSDFCRFVGVDDLFAKYQKSQNAKDNAKKADFLAWLQKPGRTDWPELVYHLHTNGG